MKKFFAMALAALAIVSCSKSIDDENPLEGGEDINSPTYATFKFNIGSGSRAAADYDPTAKPDQDAADSKIENIQLLIFNATSKALEHNVKVTGNAATVLMTAGKKKMFFLANSDKLTVYTTAIAPGVFNKTKTLDEFYALNFSAGTPQASTVNTATDARTFNFSALYTLASVNAGLPMINTNELTYTLKAGVTEAQAQGGAPTASDTGESLTNSFAIMLHFMTAKAGLKLDAGVLSAGDVDTKKPVITDVKYSVHNLARVSNYVQNYVASKPQSYYFSMKFENAAAYAAEFDGASAITVPATAAITDYVYVPENNGTVMDRGQSSYFAIQATYEPVVINRVDYNLNAKVAYTYVALATADAVNKNYIYTLTDVQGIPAGSYFATVVLFEEAAWMMKNSKPFVEADHRTEAEGLVLPEYYQQFLGAKSYYRLDIGKGTGADTEYGVLRGNRYEATVNKITGPGAPKAEDLDKDPEKPVSAKTYIHATIVGAQWTPITQSADL